MSSPLPVLVAVDGSQSALAAARWAAAEAARRGTWLTVVSVYPWPLTGYPEALVTQHDLRDGLRAQTLANLDEATVAATETVPGLEVRVNALEGDVVGSLRSASEDAALLVLGSRGLGGFSGFLLGSTAVALVAHGHCPTVVVRGEDTGPHGQILVGIDGGDTDDASLGFAFERASTTGETVIVVHAWGSGITDAVGFAALDWTLVAEAADALVAERVAPWRAKFPDVAVTEVVVRERPARALLDRAVDADLVVVGSRGRGGFAGLVLGSTSQVLVRHSPSPVVVVRA
ncbi:universal stress protein [Actinokineospora globicatena]|uniref:universal stress protein n=1 Tax=Actinokineospora globicatena TaxID=103729 RepID=UPI0020A34605|nr:universal stress protein [Actinokineospora globicatena]MCP2305860.1 Nucleotide-binding universal stress protein, UspA family [Actinokineospora globicatena]GLW80271.1 universal stress protein [Actinokineospora globicatena]GLW87100.1 universal stress protein [Actinokineospora globicatena]